MREFFRYLKNEIYNIFHNKSFLIVLSILSVIVIIDSFLAYSDYKNNLAETLNNIAMTDGVYETYPFLQLYTVYNSWIGGRVNTILTTVFFNTLPIFVVIPYGWSFLSEQKRGYDRIMACKLGKKKYFLGKHASCFISGFITATVPLLISLGITFATIPAYKPDINLALYYQVNHNKLLGDLYYLHPLCTVFLNVLMNGLFAGAWTTVPLALSFFLKNKYIVLFAPYLVLIYLIALFEKASAFRLYIGTSIINYIWLTSPDSTQSWAFYLTVMLLLILVPLGIVIERGKERMFIKFLDHDLRYGIGNTKKRIVLTFLMFAFLSLYHFFTLRIFQITNPEYFNSPVTTADYFLSVVGGYGKPNLFSDGTSDYSVPSVWLVFILWIMFINLYYPFKDLDGIGKHLVVLSGSRGVWWLSKCVWTVINTVINYLTVFVSCTFVGLIFGAKLSMQSNYYLYRTLNIDESSLTSSTVWNITSVFLMIGFSLIVLSLLQLLISLLAKPMISFFLMAAYIFAATFKQSPLLFANYVLGARNSTLVTTGLSNPLGILIGAWIILLSVAIGFFVFQYRDIIGSDN